MGPAGVHDIYRGGARSPTTTTRRGSSSVRSGWRTVEALAAYVRPDELHTAFNFDFLDAAGTPRSCARSSTARGAPRQSAPRPPGCSRTTTSRVRPRTRRAAGERMPRPDRPGARRVAADDAVASRAPAPACVHARPARLGLPLPGRGARPRGGRRPARRLPPGPAFRRTGGEVGSATAAGCPCPGQRGPVIRVRPRGSPGCRCPSTRLTSVDPAGGPGRPSSSRDRVLRLRRAEPALGDGDLHWVSGPGRRLSRAAPTLPPTRTRTCSVAMNLGDSPALVQATEVLALQRCGAGARRRRLLVGPRHRRLAALKAAPLQPADQRGDDHLHDHRHRVGRSA